MGEIETRFYAKRLTAPYKGVIQVVENAMARALSLNGVHWELQFMHEAPKSFWGGHSSTSSVRSKGKSDLIRAFARVARWDAVQGLRHLPLDPRIEAAKVKQYCDPIIDCLEQQTPPFVLQDHYECWLLDEEERQPLALLYTCCTEEEMNAEKRRPIWCAMTANELELSNTDEEQQQGLLPITYRIEQLVKKRAGQNPQVQWFLRDKTGQGCLLNTADNKKNILATTHFPATLLREDWSRTTDQHLIQRYVDRMTPRLLVLQSLSHSIRDQFEERARVYAEDVADLYHLYPTVANEERMTTIRVEARLRLALGNQL